MISDILLDAIDEVEEYRRNMPEIYSEKEISERLDKVVSEMKYAIKIVLNYDTK